MQIYAGTFILALAMLALEVTLTRLLSVVTWYYLAFFAISAAMLGMTAGATNVFLHPKRFAAEKLSENLGRTCLRFAVAVPVGLLIVCITPATAAPTIMSLVAVLVLTAACALPFYYAGIAVTLVLTKCQLPVGKVYGSDLVGASLGCFLVLGGLGWLDAPSLILLCGAIGALAGFAFLWTWRRDEERRLRRANIAAFACLALLALVNSRSSALVRPFMVKGTVAPATRYDLERWNSFSRVAVFPMVHDTPFFWAASPLAPTDPVNHRAADIDGSAATTLGEFRTTADIRHLRYDVTSVAYYVRPHGPACIIGVGGGRDVQTAILFGHAPIVGIDVNPVFIGLLRHEFRQFVNIADRPEVTLVVDEARSYLSRNPAKFSLLQMSLIDTWASTGAGALTLSENSLYTVEAWKLFLDRLSDDGLLTVSRWYDEKNLGETGRLLSLAVAALLEQGATQPARHIALVTRGRVATLVLCRRPLSPQDNLTLHETCRKLQFTVAVSPVKVAEDPLLRTILSSTSRAELQANVQNAPLRFDPPTDDDPYFFNILRLRDIPHCYSVQSQGARAGNLVATASLAGLIAGLSIMAVATVLVPLLLRGRIGETDSPAPRVLWAGAAYFSLIGAGFMLLEIALIQRLTVFLGHPVYALAVLLSVFIMSAGIGSLLSERLPLGRAPWVFLYPLLPCALIFATRAALTALTVGMVSAPMSTKIMMSIATVFPLGMVLGLFFPTGMRLVKSIRPDETPWYWALNGIFSVLASAVAVFISIFLGISVNFYVAAVCYALVLVCVASLAASSKVAVRASSP
jgi:MFS family permease